MSYHQWVENIHNIYNIIGLDVQECGEKVGGKLMGKVFPMKG